MYPMIRLALALRAARQQPALETGGVHVSHHRVLPWDLDTFLELNNGRTLTLLDLGRVGLAVRIGLMTALRREKWGLTVAGTSIRYRRRIRLFDRFEVRTRALGRDARFVYIHQTIWLRGEAACSALLRTALTDRNGIVPTDRVADAIGHPDWDPPLPDWVTAWIDAEATRPWPPG